jgi:hypothetical protein
MRTEKVRYGMQGVEHSFEELNVPILPKPWLASQRREILVEPNGRGNTAAAATLFGINHAH